MKTVRANIICGSDGTYDINLCGQDYGLDYSVIASGKTVEEAKRDFVESYEDIKETYKDLGRPFEEIEYSFYYDMPTFLQHYAYALSLASLSRITGVNQGQLSHYINGTSRPSQRTIQKIEEAISNFAAELSQVRFAL